MNSPSPIAAELGSLWIVAAIGVFIGLILFYRGFRLLQQKRLIQNTPGSKIRSASLGLVEISGLAVGPYTLIAPITGKPCFYYRTVVSELCKSGNKQQWQTAVDESLHLPFYIDDNTGRLLVNPQGAEIDVHHDFHDEFRSGVFSSSSAPENVRSFLSLRGVSGDHRTRIDEYCIKPKNALFILGTLAENHGYTAAPKPIPTQPASIASLGFGLPGAGGKKFAIALSTAPGVTMKSMTVELQRTLAAQDNKQEVIYLSSRSPDHAAQMTQQGKIAAALMKAGISNPKAWEAAGIDDPAAAVAVVSAAGSGDIVATADGPSSPTEFDLRPKVVLQKGENDSTFLISWRSQQKVVGSLGWKSAFFIWGGPALTLASVYFLLAHFGWL